MTIASDNELIHAWQRRRGNETIGTLRQRLSHPPDLVIAAYSRLHEAADDDDDDDDVDDIEDEDVDDASIIDDALDFYADNRANRQRGMSDPSDDSDLSAECRKDFDVNFDAMIDVDFSKQVEMDILGGADFSEQVEKDIRGTLHNDADWEVTSNDSDQGQHHQYLRRNKKRRKKRRPNRSYRKESVKTSGWYLQFLQPGEVRTMTYELSRSDRYGEFRCLFRMTLDKFDELVTRFKEGGYFKRPRSLARREEEDERAEILMLSALHRHGFGSAYRSARSNTHISTSEIRLFYETFLNSFYAMKDDYISMPANVDALKSVMKSYELCGLPGACGSIDVVHVKWSHCPAGDFNRAKGKESYPSLGFQCISDHNRRIMAVFGPQFGSRNDKGIVKDDVNVKFIRDGWYKDVVWTYYEADGTVKEVRGVYLICDGGYHRWPILICPYKHAHCATLEGYFSSNLESVRKDVECVFGILKKKWKILANGFLYRDIAKCEKIFIASCCLHNFLLDMTERSRARVGRGGPLGNDGIWLDGSTLVKEVSAKQLSAQWSLRRKLLAEHLHVYKAYGAVVDTDEEEDTEYGE